jgi:hypothetical protein
LWPSRPKISPDAISETSSTAVRAEFFVIFWSSIIGESFRRLRPVGSIDNGLAAVASSAPSAHQVLEMIIGVEIATARARRA